MVRDITDAERREIQRLLKQSSPSASRFAPSVSQQPRLAPSPPKADSRLKQAGKVAGRAGRLALSGKAFAAAALPGVDEADIERLPGPVKFAIDNIVSPVGLAALIAAPVTGGGSIAARVGLGAALASKPLAVRAGVDLAGRIGTDLAIAGIGTAAAKGAEKVLPDNRLGDIATLGVGLVAGAGSGVGISKAINPSVANAGTASFRAELRADKSLPLAPNINDLASNLGGNTPRPLRGIMSAVDPSSQIRTSLGKIGGAKYQADIAVGDLADTWEKVKFSQIPSAFMVKEGKALVQGQRVGWREAFNRYDDLSDVQKAALDDYKEGLRVTVERANQYLPEGKRLPIDTIWEPKFNGKGEVVYSGNSTFRPIEDIALSHKLTKQDIDRPEAVLNLYAKNALKLQVNDEYESAIKPFILQADEAFVSSDEGRKIKDALDVATDNLERAKSSAVPLPAQIERLREVEQGAKDAWSEFKSSNFTPNVTPYKNSYIYDNEDGLEELSKWVQTMGRPGGEPIPGLNTVQRLADASRFFSASLDASAGFINLLPTLFSHPDAWAKAVAGNWKSFFDPNTQMKYLSNENNYRIVTSMIRNNLASGDIEQYVSNSRGGLGKQILNPNNKIANAAISPVRTLYGTAQRGYETALTIARVEVWKNLEAMGWDERRIADFIRESTGAMDTTRMGVSANQRALESLALFSPRMFRSIASLMGDALRPHTPEGALAAQTVLRMMGAGTGLFAVANAAISIMEGETDAQIQKRMEESVNPINGRQFLSVQVGDQWYGIGGTVRAFTQALARAVSNEDEQAGRDSNPIWDFFSGRLGPATRATLQAGEAVGAGNWAPYDQIEDFPDWVKAQSAGILPFYMQSWVSEGSLPNAGALVEVAGLSSKPRTSSDILNSEAFQRYQLPWNELSDKEQDLIKADIPSLNSKANELASKEDMLFKDAIASSNSKATATLIELSTYKLSPQEKRERIQQVLRDRWVENKKTYETFNIASQLGAANTDKRRVTDAYFKVFEDARIGPTGSNQTDWDKWEELQADLDLRIAAGDFGPPERAQQYLDERRKFKLPPELQWYEDANNVVKETMYWEQRDIAFAEIASSINAMFPDIQSARELDLALENSDDLATTTSLKSFTRLLDSRTQQKRKLLKATNPALSQALKELGR